MTQTRYHAWVSGPDRHGIEDLELRELPLPSPSPGQVLVRVAAAAVNFSDGLMIAGKYQVRPLRPFVPGQEIAGIVEAVGAPCGLDLGCRIAAKVEWGGFGQYVLVREDMAMRIGDSMPWTRAAALPISYVTAMVALTETIVLRRGATILIHAGAGGLGSAAIQVARALGAHVIATAGTEAKCAVARSIGANYCIDYSKIAWVDEVAHQSGGELVSVIFDSVGGNITIESLKCLAWGGCLLVAGFSSGQVPFIPAHRLLLRRASVHGIYWNHDRDPSMLARVQAHVVEGAIDGRFQPLIGRTYNFEALPQALSDLSMRRTIGKSIIVVE